MRIVAFGTYQADSHPRISVLVEGLRSVGHEVIEINEPLGMSTADRVSMLQRPWTLPKLAIRLAIRWARLWRRGRAESRPSNPDVVLVGYLGHFDVHLARLVFPGTPITLDHLIFAAGTAVDRGTRPGALTRALSVLDRWALSAADVIILDTAEHQMQVPAQLADRSVVCPVGADHRWFDAGDSAAGATPSAAGAIRVVFFGLYTPLQGAKVIGEALALLAGRPGLSVTMIGKGQDLAATKAAAGPSAPVVWRDLVPPDELPAIVASHHIALGIFGTTAKALQVVPNKVFQSAAAGTALITSDTPPQRRALGDAAVFVPPGDGPALARAVLDLSFDSALLATRRRQAAELAKREFTSQAVVAPLADKLTEFRRRPRGPVAPMTPRAALRWPLIKQAMKQCQPTSIIEIGCGQGAMGARLAPMCPSYLAVEPDPASYRVARSRIQPRGGNVLNCFTWDLDDNQVFDMACAFEVLEHIEDDETALQDWATRIRPGGHLLLSVPAWQHMFGPSDEAVGHFRRYSPEELSTRLRANGFEPVRITLYGWPLAFLLEAIRDRLAKRQTHTEDSVDERTALSGRWLQPSRRFSGLAITIGVLPFRLLQWLIPHKGNGIVALARRTG